MMSALVVTLFGWIGCALLIAGWGMENRYAKVAAVVYISGFLLICGMGIAGVFLPT
jgi:hypothetical protein